MMEKRYEKLSDTELLSLIEHDEDAFNELYARYYRLVYFIAYEMCHNDADAKDVLQETFLKVRSAAKNVREEGKFKNWLNVVTVSKCKDLFKRNKYGNIDSENVFVKNMQREERRYLLPEKQMHFDNDKELLYHFINRLPQNQREVLVLKYFGDFSLQEIAEMMEISEGTVKSRLHYAKDNLRGMIETHNGKDKNKLLNFESLDIAIIASLLYGYEHSEIPSEKKKLMMDKNQTWYHCMIATLTFIVVFSLGLAGKTLLQNEDQKTKEETSQQESIQMRKEYNTEYKDIYFHLMDFAATSYDMEAKTLEQLQSVHDEYVKLKAENNAYYQLLVKQQWVERYETALKNK